MLDRLHHEGLVTGALDPGDFLIDPTGRWFYLGTDRIAAGSDALARADHAHWSTLVARVLTGSDRIEVLDAQPWPEEVRRVIMSAKCGATDDPGTRPTAEAAPHSEAAPRRGLFDLWRRGKRWSEIPEGPL